MLEQQKIAAKLAQYDLLEQKVGHMEETHANAVVAEDLINQMIADGTMYANADGSFQITGPDGQPKNYKPNNNE